MSQTPYVIALVTWAITLTAAMAGMWIAGRLPDAHRSTDSRDIVRTSMAMVSSMTALALGLLVSSANSSFNGAQDQVLSTSSNLIRMERVLRLYGHDADQARQNLKDYATSMMRDLFPPDAWSINVENESTLDFLASIEEQFAVINPKNDTQQWLKPHVLDVANKLVEEHFALVRQHLYTFPGPVLALLLAWLVILFGSYGLFAPRHLTAFVVLLLSSATASGAVFLILELQGPMQGIVRLSPDPLHHALEYMDRDTVPAAGTDGPSSSN